MRFGDRTGAPLPLVSRFEFLARKRARAERAYWVFITNEQLQGISEEGKWVVSMRRHLHKRSKHFLQDVATAVSDYRLLGALVERRYFHTVVLFTTADRDDIWRGRQAAILALGARERDMFWKTSRETDDDWAERRGLLWHVWKLVELYRTQQEARSNGRRQRELQLAKAVADIESSMLREVYRDRRRLRGSGQVAPLARLPAGGRVSGGIVEVKPVFNGVYYEIEPELAFVLMPFNEPHSDALMHIVREAAVGTGVRVERADSIFEPGSVIDAIWRSLSVAGIVLADISTQNANVFYELGIAHTIGKPVWILRKAGSERPPFDIYYHRYIEYDTDTISADRLKDDLRTMFKVHMSKYNSL